MELEERDGLIWPKGDQVCLPAVMEEVGEIPHILELCRGRRSCIQAGGNGGLWPAKLAPRFQSVYTFEPNRTMFHCLVVNTREYDNIVYFNAALGCEKKRIGLSYGMWPENAGATRVSARGGRIPTIRIDDLGIDDCDLLQLDVEGYEMFALKGAVETIRASKPVIVVEMRGIGDVFGYPDVTVREFILSLGYKSHTVLNFDEVFIPCA